MNNIINKYVKSSNVKVNKLNLIPNEDNINKQASLDKNAVKDIFNTANFSGNNKKYDNNKNNNYSDKEDLKKFENIFQQDMEDMFKNNDDIMKKYCNLYSDNKNKNINQIVDPLTKNFEDVKRTRILHEKTTGSNWFNMKAPEMTPELENDLKAIQLRHIIDPKKFYKKPDINGLPRFFQIGRLEVPIINGKANILKKKEVKNTLAEEFLENDIQVNYSIKKFKEIQNKKILLGKKRKKINDYKIKNKGKKKEYISK